MFAFGFDTFRSSRRFDIARGSKMSGASAFDPSDTPAWFQAVISSRCDRAALRERLAAHRGGECLEFLLVYCGLDKSMNSLQRFEHMRGLVHRFVRPGAERAVPLSPKCRQRVVDEWARWEDEGRICKSAVFPAMAEAAREIHEFLRRPGEYAKDCEAALPVAAREGGGLPRRWRLAGSEERHTRPFPLSTLVMA